MTRRVIMTTAQKVKLFIKDLLNICDQIHGKLWILSHLIKKLLMENFIFSAANCSLCYRHIAKSKSVEMASTSVKYEGNEFHLS